jgi:short-subunit dehydrogenase
MTNQLNRMTKNSEITLVTGASSGIGMHLAHEFARHGHPLVIVAPVQSELEQVAAEFKRDHNVDVRVIAKDLEHENSAQEIFDDLQKTGVQVDILCNNAGHGFHGKWWEIPLDKDLSMIRLNIEAVMRMTKLFLPPMLQRGHGRILNTASVAGFMPGPELATYYATKAFVLSWSEALAIELDDTPVSVTALCPGVTDTDFFPKGGAENIKGRQSSNVMAPQDVAKEGYEALMKEELFVVPGAANKAMIATRRILPISTQAKMNQKMNSDVPLQDAKRQRGEKEFAKATE